MTKTLKTRKGFTLTELIIVIAIIGILAAVLVPTLSGYIRKSKEAALTQEAKSISAIYETWLVDPEGAYENESSATSEFLDYYNEISNDTLNDTLDEALKILLDDNSLPIGFEYTKGELVATYTNGGSVVVSEVNETEES